MNLFNKARDKAKRNGIKECVWCGKDFKPDRRNVIRGWGNFCSKSCATKWKNRSFKLSESELKAMERDYKINQLGL